MNETPGRRSGELHVAKECSEYTGLAGSFCTITSSNLDAIPVGSKVVYASAAGETGIESDITIVTAQAEHVSGHVVLSMETNTGSVTLSGGTGAFAALQAETVVSFDGTEWHWDGTYSLTPAAAETTS
jgi:hypothetical protein